MSLTLSGVRQGEENRFSLPNCKFIASYISVIVNCGIQIFLHILNVILNALCRSVKLNGNENTRCDKNDTQKPRTQKTEQSNQAQN